MPGRGGRLLAEKVSEINRCLSGVVKLIRKHTPKKLF